MAQSDREFPIEQYPHGRITGMVIAAAHVVYRKLGYGFRESVYRRALVIELRHMGLAVEEEKPYDVFYRGQSLGIHRIDLVAEDCVIVEAKAGRLLDPEAPVQTLSYLRAASIDVALITHFGPKLAIKRMVYSGTDDEGVLLVPVS